MSSLNLEAKKMKEADVENINKDKLVDIRSVKVNMGQSEDERLNDFINQIKNPYCFKCGGLVVKVSFSDTEKTFADRLDEYFESLE